MICHVLLQNLKNCWVWCECQISILLWVYVHAYIEVHAYSIQDSTDVRIIVQRIIEKCYC